MKSTLRATLERCLAKLPLPLLLTASHTKHLSVFYHMSREDSPVYFRNGYRIKSPREFEADIDWILHRLTPVSIEQVLAAESPCDLPNRSFFLSFDDGYRELAEIVAPILRRKGVPATFFVCSNLVDNRNWLFEDQIGLVLNTIQNLRETERADCESRCLKPFGLDWNSLRSVRIPPVDALRDLGDWLHLDWSAELDRHRPYLTEAQIRGLILDGFGFGAHGVNHRVFESMTTDEQVTQIIDSLRGVAGRFGLPYRVFAFPYGEFGVRRELFERVKNDRIADRLFGTRGLIDDEYPPLVWQRLWCESHDGSLESFVRQQLGTRTLRCWRGRNVVRRRD